MFVYEFIINISVLKQQPMCTGLNIHYQNGIFKLIRPQAQEVKCNQQNKGALNNFEIILK